MLLIATNESIHGRSLGVVSREEFPGGLLDLEQDDFQEGTMMGDWQSLAVG